MITPKPTKALIYCRVASMLSSGMIEDAVKDQETCTTEYASLRGYEVVDIYRDHASGMTADRPGLKEMFAKLDQLRGEGCVVLVDDGIRIARSIAIYFDLTDSFKARGAHLEIVAAADIGSEARA